MSEEEKFAEQGRAYAELKRTRSNVATIASSLARAAELFQQIGSALEKFLANPEDQVTAVHLEEKLKAADPQRVAALIRGLDHETQAARVLQQRIDKF